MDGFSDELLIESLMLAEKLELADDFIAVLKDEIKKRRIRQFPHLKEDN